MTMENTIFLSAKANTPKIEKVVQQNKYQSEPINEEKVIHLSAVNVNQNATLTDRSPR